MRAFWALVGILAGYFIRRYTENIESAALMVKYKDDDISYQPAPVASQPITEVVHPISVKKMVAFHHVSDEVFEQFCRDRGMIPSGPIVRRYLNPHNQEFYEFQDDESYIPCTLSDVQVVDDTWLKENT